MIRSRSCIRVMCRAMRQRTATDLDDGLSRRAAMSDAQRVVVAHVACSRLQASSLNGRFCVGKTAKSLELATEHSRTIGCMGRLSESTRVAINADRTGYRSISTNTRNGEPVSVPPSSTNRPCSPTKVGVCPRAGFRVGGPRVRFSNHARHMHQGLLPVMHALKRQKQSTERSDLILDAFRV